MANINLPTPGGDANTWGTKLNSSITAINDEQNTLKSSLALVAKSGNYNDLTNKPTIPAAYTDAQAAAAAPVKSVASKTGDVTLAKGDVGLGNVDNTSDLNKPLSTLMQSALAGKASTVHSHTSADITDFTSAVQNVPGFGSGGASGVSSVNTRSGAVTLSKSDVGLANADNTSDVNKPVSTATQTALDAKAATSHTHTANQVSGLAPVATSGSYADLTNKPTIPSQYTDAQAASAAPVQSVNSKTGAVTLAKGDVGLANVDNTADVDKPVSTATQTALGTKANTSHTHASTQITDFTSAVQNVPGFGGSGGSAITTTQTPLMVMYGRFAKRDVASAAVVSAGSSTPYGQGASTDARRMMNRLVFMLQTDYPLSSGVAQPSAKYLSDVAGTTLPNGVQYVNASVGGSTSSNYLTATTAAQVGALNPAVVLHMPLSNDYANNVNPATAKTNVLNQIAAINAAVTGPVMPVHVLIHGHRRTNMSNPTYAWSAYGQVLKEIADAAPNTRVFVNLYPAFANVLQDTTDPLALTDADKVHLTDSGHALGADALRAALREGLQINTFTAVPDPTAPADTTAPTISSFTATPNDGRITWAWSGTDNVGITRWLLKRGSTTLYDGTAASYNETGLTNGTSYAATLQAYDAAGNVSTTSNASATPAAQTDTTAPTITSFTATPGSSQVALAWAATDNIAVTRYTVARGATTVYDGTATTFTDTGLTNGTAYTYTLTAYDAAGNTKTATVSATPASGATPAVFASDNFDRADGALGNTVVGNYPWSQSFDGQYAIVSGRAKPVNNNGGQSMWINDGQLNGTLKVTVYETTTGLLFRATNGVGYYVFYSTGSGAWRFGKVTALGAFTPITTATASTFVNPSTVEAIMDGSNFTIKVNGTVIITATDTTYTGTQHGIISLYNTNTADNFEHASSVVVSSDYTGNMLARFNAESVASQGDGTQVPTITSSEGSLGPITLVQLEGAAATTRPIVKTGIQNGRAVLRFDSAQSQKLQSPSTALPIIPGTATTYVYAFKRTGASSRYFGSNSSTLYHTLFNGGTTMIFANATVGTTGNVLSYGTQSILDRWVIVVAVMNGASSKMFIASAGSSGAQGTEAIVTGTLDTGNASGITMGGSGSGSGYATMDLYETRIYGEAVSDTNVGTIITALKLKLGL